MMQIFAPATEACVLRRIVDIRVPHLHFVHVTQVNLVSDSDDDDFGPSTAQTGRKRPGATQRAAGKLTCSRVWPRSVE